MLLKGGISIFIESCFNKDCGKKNHFVNYLRNEPFPLEGSKHSEKQLFSLGVKICFH